MTDEPKNKIGVLKYIASSGAKGAKFEDQPETWYNPCTEEAKEMEFIAKMLVVGNRARILAEKIKKEM